MVGLKVAARVPLPRLTAFAVFSFLVIAAFFAARGLDSSPRLARFGRPGSGYLLGTSVVPLPT